MRVSCLAEKVMGGKAMHAPLARISVPWIVAHALSVIVDRTASVSSFAQRFIVPGKLFMISFQPADAALPEARKELHDCRQNLDKRT